MDDKYSHLLVLTDALEQSSSHSCNGTEHFSFILLLRRRRLRRRRLAQGFRFQGYRIAASESLYINSGVRSAGSLTSIVETLISVTSIDSQASHHVAEP